MPILFYVCFIGELLTPIFGFRRYKHLDTALRYSVWLSLAWALLSIASVTYVKLFHQENLWMMTISTLVNYFFILKIFSFWLKGSRYEKMPFLFGVSYLVLWGIIKATIEPFSSSDDKTATLSALFIVALAILVYVKLFKEETFLWYSDPRFWITSGIFIYTIGTVLLFASYAVLLQYDLKAMVALYHINWIMNLTSYVFFIRAFLLPPGSVTIEVQQMKP